MSKWYGAIGFAETEETEPGVWRSVVTEKSYFGDVISNRWNRQVSSNSTNDDINISNSISIVADPYAVDNCSKMIYVEFMNTKWKISSIDVQYPRLILSIGGVWNGGSTQADTAD